MKRRRKPKPKDPREAFMSAVRKMHAERHSYRCIARFFGESVRTVWRVVMDEGFQRARWWRSGKPPAPLDPPCICRRVLGTSGLRQLREKAAREAGR